MCPFKNEHNILYSIAINNLLFLVQEIYYLFFLVDSSVQLKSNCLHQYLVNTEDAHSMLT